MIFRGAWVHARNAPQRGQVLHGRAAAAAGDDSGRSRAAADGGLQLRKKLAERHLLGPRAKPLFVRRPGRARRVHPAGGADECFIRGAAEEARREGPARVLKGAGAARRGGACAGGRGDDNRGGAAVVVVTTDHVHDLESDRCSQNYF